MPIMPTSPWGDPSTESFRKKHIREARVDGSVALVNTQIVAAATRMLEGLAQAHVALPEKIPSFDLAGTEHQKLGLSIRLAVPYSEETTAILAQWSFRGVQVENEPLPEFRFEGTPEQALDVNDLALATRLDDFEKVDVSGPTPYQWPGHRTIEVGDHGSDVMFLQLLFGCRDVEGVAGPELIERVEHFQRARGRQSNQGVMDEEFWRRVIPRRLPAVYSGDSGFTVRLIQAGLAAQGFTRTKVSGIYGTLTAKDIRELQKEYHLRFGNFVRAPEWSLILGPSPWESILVDEEQAIEDRVAEITT